MPAALTTACRIAICTAAAQEQDARAVHLASAADAFAEQGRAELAASYRRLAELAHSSAAGFRRVAVGWRDRA